MTTAASVSTSPTWSLSISSRLERWFFVQDEGFWKINALEELPPQPEGDTAVVGVVMTEYAFTPNVPSVEAVDVVVFHGVNQGAEPHEMVIVRLPEGMTVDQSLADESQFEQVEFIAWLWEPGQEGDVALVGSEPGASTRSFASSPPLMGSHSTHGMVAEIEVTEPVPTKSRRRPVGKD